MDDDELTRVVRTGYDAVSLRYRGDTDRADADYANWVGDIRTSVAAGARVLDVGCGNGVPVVRDLTASGYRVTGVDLSPVQIERAEALVPAADFVCGDIADCDWPAATFDAVLALYSLIHVPLSRQQAVLANLATWTRPGGVLLLVAGATAYTGIDDDWLGSGAAMAWSHPGADTYRGWLDDAGWRLVEDRFVPEGSSGHQLFRARRARE